MFFYWDTVYSATDVMMLLNLFYSKSLVLLLVRDDVTVSQLPIGCASDV